MTVQTLSVHTNSAITDHSSTVLLSMFSITLLESLDLPKTRFCFAPTEVKQEKGNELNIPTTTWAGQESLKQPPKPVRTLLPTQEGELGPWSHPQSCATLYCDLPPAAWPSFSPAASPRSEMQTLNTSWGKQTPVPMQAVPSTLNTSLLSGWSAHVHPLATAPLPEDKKL